MQLQNKIRFKSYLVKELSKQGIQVKAGTRKGYHIRFSIDGKSDCFDSLPVEILDSLVQMSSMYETKIIKLKKNLMIDGVFIEVGEEIHWVNTSISNLDGGINLFRSKDLSPDKIGLSGYRINLKQLRERVERGLILSDYDTETAIKLMSLFDSVCNSTGTNFHLEDNGFSKKDLNKISADFGEILAAAWVLEHFKYEEIYFPRSSNEELIDFYAYNDSGQHPFSVKSGFGSNTSIAAVIRNLDMIGGSSKIVDVLKIIEKYSAYEQMIEIHKYLDTTQYRLLCKVMAKNPEKLTLENTKNWVEDRSVNELCDALEEFWKVTCEPKLKNEDDKLRLVISPLGESAWRILNEDEHLKKSFTFMMQKFNIIQVNVDVKNTELNIAKTPFRESKFKFGWPGFTSRNKLGFKMIN